MDGEGGIQNEIQELEAKLQQKREELSRQHEAGEIEEMPHEKETLHEVIQEKIGETAPPAAMPTPAPAPTPVPAPITPQAGGPIYLTDEFKDQVQELINIAFNKSIDEAVSKVKATNNAALIDAFHDALVDELYNYLVEQGKLKPM